MSLQIELEVFFKENSDSANAAFGQDLGDEGLEAEDSFDGVFPDVSYDCIDQHGGEGEGDQYWTVYKFVKGSEEVLIKFYGWYASYIGSEYTDFSVVKPVERLVTFYE
jgi:hypothetical protein